MLILPFQKKILCGNNTKTGFETEANVIGTDCVAVRGVCVNDVDEKGVCRIQANQRISTLKIDG